MRQFVIFVTLLHYLNNVPNSYIVFGLWITLLTVSCSTIRMSFVIPLSVKNGLRLMLMCANILLLIYLTLISVIG